MRFQNSMNREVIHKMKKTEIRRGDIFSYDFGTRIGSIQSGVRPVLVIQADNFNANAPTVIVASITSVIKKRYLPSHIILGEDFGLTKPSMVLLEQIQTVILSRLVDTFFSRISLTMQPPPKPHSTACVLPWEEGRHWQSRSSGCSSS